MIEEDYGPNLTQSAKNMMILNNEKAHMLGNYLRRYFFRETGFVSQKNTKVFSIDFIKKKRTILGYTSMRISPVNLCKPHSLK